MTSKTRILPLLIAYAAIVCVTILLPSQFWDVTLNLMVPVAVCVSLILAFHFRSTSAFAFSVATATSVHVVDNYGGYLFGDLIFMVLGEDTEALYLQDIVYNHLCLLGGILGFAGGRILECLSVKQDRG